MLPIPSRKDPEPFISDFPFDLKLILPWVQKEELPGCDPALTQTPDDRAQPPAIDPPLLPGRPRLPEAPSTQLGRGVSDPVHLSPAKGHGDTGGACDPARPRASCGTDSRPGPELEGLCGQKQGGVATGEKGTGAGERSARRWRSRRCRAQICLGAKRGSEPGRRRGAEARAGRGRQAATASSPGAAPSHAGRALRSPGDGGPAYAG